MMATKMEQHKCTRSAVHRLIYAHLLFLCCASIQTHVMAWTCTGIVDHPQDGQRCSELRHAVRPKGTSWPQGGASLDVQVTPKMHRAAQDSSQAGPVPQEIVAPQVSGTGGPERPQYKAQQAFEPTRLTAWKPTLNLAGYKNPRTHVTANGRETSENCWAASHALSGELYCIIS